MTDQSLDSILSGAGASAPVLDQTPRVDEPETLIVDPVENVIGTEHVEGQPHPDDDPSKANADPNKVGAAFKAQREGVAKRYTEEVVDLRKTISDQGQQVAQLLQLVTTMQSRQQPQQQPPQPTPNLVDQLLGDDPGSAIRGAVSPDIDRLEKAFFKLAEMGAKQTYGADRVKAAEEAFLRAYHSGQIDPVDAHKVINDGNRWEAAVHWHQRAEIGNDPAAYRERMKAEILAEIRQTGRLPDAAQPSAGAAPAVMPSNFADARNVGDRSAGPSWTGPPSLQDIFKR